MKKSVYDIITERIIDRLEQGEIPWRQPWKVAEAWPTNLISKKAYQGVNVMLLAMQRYSSPYWLTFKQALELGGNVKKGEKSTPICFWSFVDKTDPVTSEAVKVPLLRYYSVFNVAQVENLDLSKIPTVEAREIEENDATAAATAIVAGYKNAPEISFGHSQACYIPSADRVEMPERSHFIDDSSFFGVYFHELAHSTAAEHRLHRRSKNERRAFASFEYSCEELCAELASCFLTSEAGLLQNQQFDQSAAYIQSWLKALKNDNKLLITAAGQAQKAANWILGRTPETPDQREGGEA